MGEIIHSVRIKGLKIKRVDAFFDSGASTTFIRSDLAEEIKLPKFQEVSTYLADRSGSKGVLTELTILINTMIIPTRGIIVDRLDRQLIIGVDFMQITKSFLDFSSDRLRFKEEIKLIKNRRYRL